MRTDEQRKCTCMEPPAFMSDPECVWHGECEWGTTADEAHGAGAVGCGSVGRDPAMPSAHDAMTTIKSTPKPTTPMCDAARKLDTLKARIRHYHTCQDERCRERSRQTRELGAALVRRR